jgi:GNAT superfamily N-acetyltransferase
MRHIPLFEENPNRPKQFKDKWEKAEYFVDDVQELSWRIEEKYNADLKISYDENTESIILSFIGVPDDMRRQNIASKMMTELCEYADKHRLSISLHANGDLGTDIKILKRFYTKFGFRDKKKFVKGVGELMIRP